MTDEKELARLIAQVRVIPGAMVNVKHEESEGRTLVDTIQISGIKGCGPYPMSPIAAAEKMRSIVHDYARNTGPFGRKRRSFCA